MAHGHWSNHEYSLLHQQRLVLMILGRTTTFLLGLPWTWRWWRCWCWWWWLCVIWGWFEGCWWMLTICFGLLFRIICRSCLVNYHPRTEAAGGELATTTTSPRSRFTFWEMVTRIWKAATSYQRRRSDTFTWEMVTTISWEEGGEGIAEWEMVTSPTKCCQDVAAICWVGFWNKLLMT